MDDRLLESKLESPSDEESSCLKHSVSEASSCCLLGNTYRGFCSRCLAHPIIVPRSDQTSSKPKDEVLPRTTMEPSHSTTTSSRWTGFKEQNKMDKTALASGLLYSPPPDDSGTDRRQPLIKEELAGI